MFEVFRLRSSDQRTLAALLFILTAGLGTYAVAGKQGMPEPKQYQFRIDLNTATIGELQTLPGIGPKLAEGIVQYRDENAPLSHFDEIMNVRGIGVKRHSTMKPYFTD